MLVTSNTYVRVKSNFWSGAARISPMVHIAWPNNDICKRQNDTLLSPLLKYMYIESDILPISIAVTHLCIA